MKPLPGYADALKAVLRHVPPLGRSITLPLVESIGHTLVEPIAADRDLPPFNRSMMDGYAMRAADAARGQPLPVIGEVPAGALWTDPIPPGSCVSIATGAPVPDELDCVVQHEWTDRNDPLAINVSHPIEPGHAIHPRGSDAQQGDELIAAHTTLGPQHLGIAASIGATKLTCVEPPRAMILTSGDEVLDPDQSVEPHQIRNSNGIMLQSLLARMGARVREHRHLPDQRETTITAVRNAMCDSDLVITVGGISAGKRDYFHDAYETLAIDRALGGAAIQPGRPITIGRATNNNDRDCWIISLPGNPVSSLACACLFIWPMIERMLGRTGDLPWRAVTLAQTVRPNAHRQAFRPALLVDPDRHSVRVPNWAGSGDLAHTATTHGLAELPVQHNEVEAGTTLRFLPWP